jgi:3',5'-cyclic AMP phosphodiesterase CpdA
MGSIKIVANSDSKNKTVITFTGGDGIGNFNLTNNDTFYKTKSFNNLTAGRYTITENVPADWSLKEIIVSGDTDSGSTIRTPSITVDLDAGETITITFNNTEITLTGNFTIIVLPDTQFYSASYPSIFTEQTNWIVNNLATMKIAYVAHEGDLVDNFALSYQWLNAYDSLSILNGRTPWGIAPGNHDGLNVGGTSENLDTFTKYFGDANSFRLFSAGGDDYLVFQLQYDASIRTLAWANKTISDYPNRRVIVVTHDYLTTSGARDATGNRIWQSFVSPHADQVFLVLCGHNHGEAKRVDTVKGHTVYQILADYQSRDNGGDGWLRILEFYPAEDKIIIKTYSTHLNQHEVDANSQFALSYDMTSTNP